MKILVIGSGGREHAIIRKLYHDAAAHGTNDALQLFAAPGNPGMEPAAKLVALRVDDIAALLDFAVKESIDLTIVGPEVPLAMGIVDRFSKRGLRIFGPTADAARLESSKSFAKGFMTQAGIPTPAYREFTDADEALGYVDSLVPPIVIKADGLAAGKGVTVAQSKEEAREAVLAAMQDHAFGAAGERIVIEQFVTGSELSVMAFVDQNGFAMMPAIQDHKQVHDHDEGQNTGGMGTFFPVPAATASVMQKVHDEIFFRVMAELRRQGIVYRGVLFAGIIVQDGQPYVIEFNARFGDPETQIALELLQTALLPIMEAVLDDRVGELSLAWSKDAAVCVVLTSGGYPGAYQKGYRIAGLDRLAPPAYVLHAGTARDLQGHIVTDGGRVLGVIGHGKSLTEARQIAYEAVQQIQFQDKHFRTDIGARK